MIEISHVEQSFRVGFWMNRKRILHDVCLQVPRGTIFGFLGANGAGKTTLIHLIAGLRKPFAGSVKIAGFEASTPEARSRLGYLPERPYFHEHLTGDSMLRYFGRLSGMSDSEMKCRIPEVLGQVGLRDVRKLELKRFSKGMLQRIGIAQALLHDPELLVLDEPMSGLDPLGRKEMRELILKLARDGHTLVFSSHVIPDVEAVCNEVALIQGGRVVGAGPIRSLLSSSTTGIAQPHEVEIAYSGIDFDSAKTIAELGRVERTADGFRAYAENSQALHRALEKLLAAKAEIHSVAPVRPSLEDLFSSFYKPRETASESRKEGPK